METIPAGLGLSTRRVSFKSYISLLFYYMGYGTEMLCQRIDAFLQRLSGGLGDYQLKEILGKTLGDTDASLCGRPAAKKTVPFTMAGQRRVRGPLWRRGRVLHVLT